MARIKQTETGINYYSPILGIAIDVKAKEVEENKTPPLKANDMVMLKKPINDEFTERMWYNQGQYPNNILNVPMVVTNLQYDYTIKDWIVLTNYFHGYIRFKELVKLPSKPDDMVKFIEDEVARVKGVKNVS